MTMEHLIASLRRAVSGTILYNYLFIAFLLAYSYLLRDLILDTSIGAVYAVKFSPLFGIMVLAVILLGTYALLMKTRELRAAGVKSAGGIAFAVCVLNWVVVICLAFTALQSFGIKVTEETDKLSGFENAVIAITIFTAIIQGLAAFGFLVRMSEPYEKPIGQGRRVAASMAAFVYLCISYTVVWETIVYGSMSTTGAFDVRTGEGIFNIIGWLLCFALLYPPMRLPFILQELQDIKKGGSTATIAVSYAAVVLSGLIPLFKNPFM
jgi:hypothetical protein